MILLEFSLNPFMFKNDQLFQYITRSTPLEFKKTHLFDFRIKEREIAQVTKQKIIWEKQ